MDKLPAPEYITTIISGVLLFFGNKLWNNAKERAKAKADEAKAKALDLEARIKTVLLETRSVMMHLIRTAPPETTFDQMKIYLKGALAIRLAAAGFNQDDLNVKPFANALIAEMLDVFSKSINDTKGAPIFDELKKAAGGN